MRFLADMGVSQQVVEWLRATGHEAVHLRDEGLQRLPNGEILQKAGREQRTVLTFDLISVKSWRPAADRLSVWSCSGCGTLGPSS
jgi:predicted nuclease of predicted toxin-antitoxin system